MSKPKKDTGTLWQRWFGTYGRFADTEAGDVYRSDWAKKQRAKEAKKAKKKK